jgi:nicastrin
VEELFVHLESDQKSADEITQFFGILKQNGQDITVSYAADTTPGIPPSSLMSFIQSEKTLVGVVLAEYNEQYTNKYIYRNLKIFF